MVIRAVNVPQMGEGLQEVLLLRTLKVAGEYVNRNEPLYEIETDKAVVEMESPFEGRVVEWLLESGIVPVGAEVARIDVVLLEDNSLAVSPESAKQCTDSSANVPTLTNGVAPDTAVRRHVPPRTIRYLRERGLLELVDLIPASSRKLMPEDVDAFLIERENASPAAIEPTYVESDLVEEQKRFNRRLPTGIKNCAPATVELHVEWTALDSAREQIAQASLDKPPSHFVLLLWCVTKAMAQHPKFRSALTKTGLTLRTYPHVNLGIAVSLTDDRLVTAVIHHGETFKWPQFVANVAEEVRLARNGVEKLCDSVTLVVSNIGSLGIDAGIPLVVPPAVATLAVGRVDWRPVRHFQDGCIFRRFATLTLAFDHRIVNGAGCAVFLNDIKRQVEQFTLPVES